MTELKKMTSKIVARRVLYALTYGLGILTIIHMVTSLNQINNVLLSRKDTFGLGELILPWQMLTNNLIIFIVLIGFIGLYQIIKNDELTKLVQISGYTLGAALTVIGQSMVGTFVKLANGQGNIFSVNGILQTATSVLLFLGIITYIVNLKVKPLIEKRRQLIIDNLKFKTTKTDVEFEYTDFNKYIKIKKHKKSDPYIIKRDETFKIKNQKYVIENAHIKKA